MVKTDKIRHILPKWSHYADFDNFELNTHTIDGKTYDMPTPDGFELREQSNSCKAKNHICSTLNGNLTCCKLILKKDSQGNFEYFSLEPCSKSKTNKIMDV